MLQRILPVKPWIELTMDEYPVRLSGAARSKTKSDTGERPYPVHHHAVEATRILMQPAPEARRKAISAQKGLTESVYWTRNAVQEWLNRIVETYYLNSGADLLMGYCKLAQGLRRTTSRWVTRIDDVERMHGMTVQQFSQMNLLLGAADAF